MNSANTMTPQEQDAVTWKHLRMAIGGMIGLTFCLIIAVSIIT